MIQISPTTETPDISAPGLIHEPKPEKKDGFGIFAKILAGLLRKTGEKDAPSVPAGEKAAAGTFNPGIKDPESAGSEVLAALFPDVGGGGKGKKPGKTGAPAPGTGSGTRPVETQTRKTGGKTSGGEHDGDLTNGDPLFFGLSEIAAEAKTPAAMERAGPGNEAVPPEPALGLSPGGYETGLSGGTGPEGEPENGEVRALEKGKTGDKTKTPGFPEGGGEDSGQNRDIRGLFSLDSRKSETPGGGKEAGGRSADPRSRDKRRDRINLEVRDLRTRDGFLPDSPAGTFSARPAAGQERPLGGTGEADITLEFRGDNPGGEAPDSAQNSWETRSAQSFEHILARELHENLNGDIVRHASMVLRDQGQGTIRLSLKPESLGNVKIRLEMAENKITGHIVVESEEALRAFEREVHSLEQSFRDSGFDGAKLDMSLAQDGGRPGDRWNGEETGRFFLSERMAASQYDAALEDPGLFAAEVRNGMYTRNGRISVNMLV